jgi:hypothetical protein
MKYQRPDLSRSVSIMCILFILSLPMAACNWAPDLSQLSTHEPPDIGIVAAVEPPATPLICPNQSSNNQPQFVEKNGTSFSYKGAPITFYGYTSYPASIGGATAWHSSSFTHYIDHLMDMGAQLGQNLIRPTDYWSSSDPHPAQSTQAIWENVDYLVCAAQQRGIFVDMDLSAFQKVLQSQHLDDFNPAYWEPFLTAVGEHYSNQSTIAFYSIVGEPPIPQNSSQMDQMIDFYRATTDTLRAADPHHLITAGGFNHMEEESAQLPWWQDIYALPNNDIAAFKTYSLGDLQLMPSIAAFAKKIEKPALDEEFGIPQSIGDATFNGGSGILGIQTSRAQFYQNVYTTGANADIQGFVFWDLGCDLRSDSYQVNPQTPATWQVVKQYGPDTSQTQNTTQSLCA